MLGIQVLMKNRYAWIDFDFLDTRYSVDIDRFMEIVRPYLVKQSKSHKPRAFTSGISGMIIDVPKESTMELACKIADLAGYPQDRITLGRFPSRG